MKAALKKLHQVLSEYIDVKFTLIVVGFTVGFYYFNLFFIGITDPQGRLYSAFLTNHLDYIVWAKNSILHTARFIADAFGTHSHLAADYTLVGANKGHITIAFACVGYGVTGFWLAFIIAQSASWQKKVAWCIGGSVALWFINCWRIALLLMAFDNRWQVNRFVEHHTLFNIAAYVLIFLMIYLYYKTNKKDDMITADRYRKNAKQPLPTAVEVAL